MDLFELAVAKKLAGGGGGGGGGSSDFSTAELSVDISGNAGVAIPSLFNIGDQIIAVSMTINRSGTYTFIMYKGSCGISLLSANNYTVNGNATDMGGGSVLATGDCTITITS